MSAARDKRALSDGEESGTPAQLSVLDETLKTMGISGIIIEYLTLLKEFADKVDSGESIDAIMPVYQKALTDIKNECKNHQRI